MSTGGSPAVERRHPVSRHLAVVDVVVGWLLTIPFVALVGLLGAFALARSGWGIDGLSVPFATELAPSLPHLPPWAPLYHYLFSSPVGAALAAVLGIGTSRAYQVLHVVVLVVGMLALLLTVRARFGDLAARAATVAFAASQTSAVLLARIGGYDPFTVVLGGFVAVNTSVPIGALLGVVWATSAFEQAAAALVGLVAIRLLTGFGSLRALASAAVGLAIGRAAVLIWLRWAGAEGTRLTWIRHFGLSMFVEMFFRGLVIFLLTATGGALVLGLTAIRTATPSTRSRLALAWVGSLAIATLPVVLVDDQTRVFACIWWPMLLTLTLELARRAPAIRLGRSMLGAIALAVVVPAIVVSHGSPFLATHHWLRVL